MPSGPVSCGRMWLYLPYPFETGSFLRPYFGRVGFPFGILLGSCSPTALPRWLCRVFPAPSRCKNMAEAPLWPRVTYYIIVSIRRRQYGTKEEWWQTRLGRSCHGVQRYLHSRQEQKTLRGTCPVWRCWICALAASLVYLRPYLHVAPGRPSIPAPPSPEANSHGLLPDCGLRTVESGSTEVPRCLCYEPGGQYWGAEGIAD